MLDRVSWRASGAADRKQLDGFLLARALEHDAPGVLLALARDWLRNERIVRPRVGTLSRRVAAARDAARAETYHRLASPLTSPRPARSDGLLDVDADLGMTRLAWLRRGATAATPEVLKAELAKLEFVRGHGADRLDLSTLPAVVGASTLGRPLGGRSCSPSQPVVAKRPAIAAPLSDSCVPTARGAVSQVRRHYPE